MEGSTLDGAMNTQHWYTLEQKPTSDTLPHLCIELYQDPLLHENRHWKSIQSTVQGTLNTLLPIIFKKFEAEHILQRFIPREFAQDTTLEADIYWVSNPQIQIINEHYRNKAMPTDVLSFPLYDLEAEDDSPAVGPDLPEIHIGSIFLSVDWAIEHLPELQGDSDQLTIQTEPLLRYLYERLCHGLLHLMGVNHDTLEDYNRVVAIQKQVLYEFFEVHCDLT